MTKPFSLWDSNFSKYLQIIGKEFVKTKTAFLRRYGHIALDSPMVKGTSFPIFGDIDMYFKAKVKKEMTEGVLFYKNGYEFLKTPEKWAVIKVDVSISPTAILYFYNGRFFSERGYMQGNITHNDGRRFKKLHRMIYKKFDKIKFEDIMGLFVDKNNNFEYLLYHTYSDGMPLDRITKKTPKAIKNYLKCLIMNAFRELNDNGINYTECQPTNIRYGFKDRLILNPHNCISFRGELNNNVSDLACLFYTNDWLREDIKKMCSEYLKSNVTSRKLEDLVRRVKNEMICLEAAVSPQVTAWQQRNIISVPHIR